MESYILKEVIVTCIPVKYLDIDIYLYPYTSLCSIITQLRVFVCRLIGGVVVLIKSRGLSQFSARTT